MKGQPITFDYVPLASDERRNGFRTCAVCLEQFRGRKRRVICGKRECRAEHMRRFHAGTLRIPKPQQQFLVCACGTRFMKSHGNRKHCTRCIELTTKSSIPARKQHVEQMLPMQGPPSCPMCGRADVKYGSDPMTGTSLVWCPACGEQRLPRVGKVQCDQREVLEAELLAVVASAHAPVDPAMQERARGRSHITRGRAGNFLIGRGVTQKAEVA